MRRLSMMTLRVKSPTDCILLCLHVRNRHRNSPTYWGPRFCHLNNKSSSCWDTSTCAFLGFASLTQPKCLAASQELRIIPLLDFRGHTGFGSRGWLTLSASWLSPDSNPSKAGWQCHRGCAPHRKVGPATASEPRSFSRMRQNTVGDLTSVPRMT